MNKLEEAVRNNAIWCDTVSRLHGANGQFSQSMWMASEPTPPFFPNVITLSPDKENAQLSQIERLLADANLKDWGVKDSFKTINLDPFGFQEVMNGEWIFRASGTPSSARNSNKVQWRQITCNAELVSWENAWRGDTMSKNLKRVFLSPLLDDRRISILGAFEDSRIVAGGIACQTGSVVGVSNMFLRKRDEAELRAQCIQEIECRHPDVPMVGYESGGDLEAMIGIGFESIGPVRVWVKP